MTSAAPSATGAAPNEPAIRRILRATEVDTRMLGMIGALALIWVGFHLYTIIADGEGLFLTPRNLWNLSVQTSSIAIMATGMVLIIVMRHIDLSVGSILGFVSTIIGVAQVRVLPLYLGLDNPAIWIVALLLGVAVGAAIGALHGSLVAYFGVPAFIVTLGGQLFWRGAAWWVTSGQTIAPLDERFALMGGGPYGSIGATASWALAALACAGIVFGLYAGRQRRARFRFPQRPMWAEYLIAAVGCFVVLGATTIVNAYPWPERVAERYAADHNIPVPDGGLFISTGYAIPVLIALVTGLVMTFLARRTRFGRYVYSIGGNPEAAELAGINTKKITILVFTLMGALAAVSACIDSARLDSATNVLGQFDELYVIAAAVIGGTSLAGGVGTIYGALIGAVVIQSLQSAWCCSASTRPISRWSSASCWSARSGSTPSIAAEPPRADPMDANALTPLVEMKDISIAFGGLKAVDRASVDLYPGEVVGLLGHNGAGKSCLIKILSGAYKRDEGQIFINGEAATINNPRDAKQYGIETIYQTLALADNVDAASNLYLGRELLTRWGTLDDASMEAAARKVMGRLNPNFRRFKEPVTALSGGQRQSVAIARAIHFDARILIMDEPTAALGPAETAQVGELVKQLKSEGIGIFLISHDIHDVFDLADRVAVMKNGQIVGTGSVKDMTKDEVLGMIILGKCPPGAVPGPGAMQS